MPNKNRRLTDDICFTQIEDKEEVMDEEKEYVVFTVKASDGSEVLMAIVDEFDYLNKHYIVSEKVEGDTLCDEGQYIYRAKITEDDFTAEKITNSVEYNQVVKAYMEMEA